LSIFWPMVLLLNMYFTFDITQCNL
jgi:hypothetical protein